MSTVPHYPSYDVMREAKAWDDHTREIVQKRLGPYPALSFLTPGEGETLGAIAGVLIDDFSLDILDYITTECDRRIKRRVGEGQRQAGVPPEADLLRQGLAAIETTARAEYGQAFRYLTVVQRQDLLGRVERAEMPDTGPWRGLPQKDLFQKLLTLAVEAYYSHPAVWSTIGYGGPAYPRGYVRSELGLIDPWEARREA
ncbi:MAG: gluconate 2-dehydrogenase subunit 3 family protein [Bacteroidota bacterium]